MTVIVIQDEKHAGETRQRGFDLTPFSTNYWRKIMRITAGFCVRPAPAEMALALGYEPRESNSEQYGYEFVASVVGGGSQGTTGTKEPRWSADPVTDGSIIWTRRPITGVSLFRTISNPSAIQWIGPDEMEVTNPVAVVGSVLQIAAHHAGGTEGEQHRVIARVPYSDASIEDYAIDWTILDDQVE
ncbi:MAG TPA: hypothetical protein VGD45_20615 [Steroidobacter sp.]|uniref:hypothetical protein n=1 Tax=Steroidobacter sp. TaxID=1978227 RepID=UPI002ED89718